MLNKFLDIYETNNFYFPLIEISKWCYKKIVLLQECISLYQCKTTPF